jgi:ElaB/YqjD/DUF883 family membrane-anchored ribosome-binding protein
MAEDRHNGNGGAASQVRDEADDMFEAARAEIEGALQDAHVYLKRNWSERPVTLVAAALGVGVLIGLLLGGRR